MDELQHKKKQQQTNQRPKTKTFPRFFSSSFFSRCEFFFCAPFPTSMFKAHPTLIAKTTYTRSHTHPKWEAKYRRKFNYHRQFHLPCSMYGNYAISEHTRVSLDANEHGHTHLLVSPIIKWNKRHFFRLRVIFALTFLWFVPSSLLLRIELCFCTSKWIAKLFSRLELSRRKMLWLIEDTVQWRMLVWYLEIDLKMPHCTFLLFESWNSVSKRSIWKHVGVSWKMD